MSEDAKIVAMAAAKKIAEGLAKLNEEISKNVSNSEIYSCLFKIEYETSRAGRIISYLQD